MKSFLRKSKIFTITLLIVNLLFAGNTMGQATITTAGDGNWNSTTVNAPWPGGVVPSSLDNVQIRPGDNVTVTANATINSITFLNTSTASRTLTVNSGVTLTVSGLTGIITMQNAATGNTTAIIAGAGTINCSSLTVGGTVTTTTGDGITLLTSTLSTFSISGNLFINAEDNGTAENDARFSLSSGTVTVAGTVVLDSDTDDNNADATFTMELGSENGTLVLTGATPFSLSGLGGEILDLDGVSGGNTSTVNYNGANQPVQASTYRNLVLSGSGTKTSTGVTNINGTLSILEDISLTVAGFNFAVAGTTTIDGTLTSNNTAGTKTFDNIIISATGEFNSIVDENYTLTGSLNVNAAAILTSGSGTWTFNGNSTISGTATITTALFTTAYSNTGIYSFSSLTVSGSGNFTNNGTINVSTTLAGSDGFIQGPGDILNFGGASITVNAFTATAANNTVNYNGGIQNVRAVAYQNLTLSGTGAKMVTGSTVNLTLSMQGTASATGTSPTFGASATLEYAGSAAQTTTDVEFKSTAVSPLHVIINNSNGVTLHAARTINGKLTLTNGIFSLPTGTIFTIANGNTNTVGGAPFSATKHIATQVNYSTGAKGFLRVNNMAAAAAYLFPAGDGTNYLPVTLTPSGTLANNMFSVCSFVGLTVDGEPNGIPFTAAQKHNTVDAVWTVNYHGTGSPTAPSTNMTVGWPASLEGINFTAYPNPLIGIAHYGPVKWGTTVGTGDNNANTATRTNITQFSPFGVGKIDPAGGTLAIKIIYFNGSKGNNVNNLYWQAECTSSFAKFAIERSTNGVDFTGISVVTATQARCALPFNYNDYTAPEGNVYYRIRIIDVDGMVSYSAIVKLGSPVKAIELAGFMPNPVSNIAQLKINTTKPDVVNLVVIAMDGKILQRTTVILQPGSSIINMDMTRLPAAAYLLKGIFSDGESNAIKFIKQ